MNYSDIKYFDVINGLGIRVSIFVSGCSHHCEHCFNKNTWNENFGNEFTDEIQNDIFKYIDMYNNIISGISLLGGDPTYYKNINPLIDFIDKFKSKFPNKNIWIWSGFTWEQINSNKNMFELVSKCDVLVDGKFIDELKDLKLKFRGSKNQRIIDIKQSINNNKLIEYIV